MDQSISYGQLHVCYVYNYLPPLIQKDFETQVIFKQELLYTSFPVDA